MRKGGDDGDGNHDEDEEKSAPSGEVDKIIGQRMRSFRLANYMSQEELGTHLGVTFQQIQKYEKGTNRLSGSRLIAAAKVLGTSVKQIVGSNGRAPQSVQTSGRSGSRRP